MADPERSDGPTRGAGCRAPLLQMRGIVKEFPGVRALDEVDLDVAGGRGALPAGPERGRQVDADQGPGRGATARTRARSAGRARRSRSARRTTPTPPASPPSTRSSTSSTACRSRRTSSWATSRPASGSAAPRTARGRGPGAPAPARPPRDPAAPRAGPAVGGGQADRQHGAGAVPRRAADRHGRAVAPCWPHDEVDNLFRVIRELTAHGVAVVYISHRLEEIREIGDRVTVLKDGRTVARNLPRPRHPDRRGGPPDDRPHHRVRLPRPRAGDRRRRRRARGRRASAGAGEFADVSFTVRAGEIVGLAGLVGSGRSEILETIYGARRPDHGHRAGPRASAAAGRRCRRPCGPAWAWPPRSARARPCCWTSRCTATSPWPPSPVRPGRLHRAAARSWPPRRGRPASWTCAPPTDAAGTHPFRRQPAEGRAGTLAARASARCCCSTSRRAASTSARAPRSTS